MFFYLVISLLVVYLEIKSTGRIFSRKDIYSLFIVGKISKVNIQ